MTPHRLAGLALALAPLAVPAAAEETAPRLSVQAETSAAGESYGIRVSAQAPLPDGTRLVVRLDHAGATSAGDRHLAQQTVEVQGGTILKEVTLEAAKTLPGEYVVAVEVDGDQTPEVRRKLKPSLRRLGGETRVLVGGRAQFAAAVNVAARTMLAATGKLQEGYPALAAMLAKAWQKELPAAEWKTWPWREQLLRTCQAVDAARLHPAMRLLPRSVARAQSLSVEVQGMISTIDNFTSGQKRTDEPMKPRREGDPRIRTSVDGLHAELYAEGLAAYAASTGRLRDDVEAAYAARRGKGAGNWGNLESGWADTIAKMSRLWEEFEGLGWSVERGLSGVQLREALLGVREYAALCGKTLRGEASEETGELERMRDALRPRIAGIAWP
jgi:hypothetical protein